MRDTPRWRRRKGNLELNTVTLRRLMGLRESEISKMLSKDQRLSFVRILSFAKKRRTPRHPGSLMAFWRAKTELG